MESVATTRIPAPDELATLRRLWRRPEPVPPTKPGPKPTLGLEAIITAAVAIADAHADAPVSLRAVASRLGCTPMALYTHVADRRELVDLMYDHVHAELAAPVGESWVARLEAWAAGLMEVYARHRWIREVSLARAVLGPHEQQAMEWLLESLEPANLARADAVAVVAALFSLVRSTAATVHEARVAAAVGDEAADWRGRTAALATVVPDFAIRFPRSTALVGVPDAGGAGQAVAGAAAVDPVGPMPFMERAARRGFARGVALVLAGAASIAGAGGDR
jgi:AcrR family transcriptional regulator